MKETKPVGLQLKGEGEIDRSSCKTQGFGRRDKRETLWRAIA